LASDAAKIDDAVVFAQACGLDIAKCDGREHLGSEEIASCLTAMPLGGQTSAQNVWLKIPAARGPSGGISPAAQLKRE
jgi:hypothetical protein